MVGQVNNGQSVGPQMYFPSKGVFAGGNYTAPVSVYMDAFNNLEIVFARLPLDSGQVFHYFPKAVVEEPRVYWDSAWRDITLIGIGVIIIMLLLAILVLFVVFYASKRFPSLSFSVN